MMRWVFLDPQGRFFYTPCTKKRVLIIIFLPPKKPQTREETCYMLADWHLSKPEYQHFYHPEYKTKMMDVIVKDWKCDGMILQYNWGCEGLSVGIAGDRLGMLERGHKVMAYEGNMGDEREFEEKAVANWMDVF